MNQIVAIEKCADWLVNGSATMRSVAIVKLERSYGVTAERIAEILADVERGLSYYQVRDLLLKEIAPLKS